MEFPANLDETLPDLFTTGQPVTRAKIMAAESALIDAGGTTDLVEYHNAFLRHYHAPGIYARELFIPEGTLIVGKIHKHSHHNNISLGRIAVATEFDSYIITAPHSFVSLPGTKRIVYALEDTMWTTYHPTELTDPDMIVESVTSASYEEYDAYVEGLRRLT